MVFCPFCEGQGLICKADIVGKNIQIYICEECDSMWKTPKIEKENCYGFGDFMKEIGLKGLWSELQNVERL
ncbi:hypothetical protein [Pseudobacteroides cellulosolvens]|uniref:Transcription factor zinc-finger domain-containing protein n=1 Tax=Pseudobacteroides cellulosolvens ATCC 35603 = DSM 2933 TaxID=398512 RepID=A0A0L6JMF1_9FIRM|nr:hypothetical protein [Pseudobacteroides cellulosolvens]KNY26935.1 hypothetical protein Bccel_2200 [Pseudobacteroides cellulosolvens ATCC 35603 = DSM 2933]